MGDIKIDIVIPSMGRADRVLAKEAITHGILCVPESEKEEYEKYNPDMPIETHPDSVKGIAAKRQWIIEHHKNVFMLDDDIKCLCRLYVESGEDVRMTKEEAYDIIQYIGNCAHLAGCYLFGLNKEKTPLTYISQRPIWLTGIIYGSCGILDGGGLYYNERCTLTEDYWLCAYNAYKNRICWIDTRFAEMAGGDAFGNKGGCATYRTVEKNEQETLYLRQLFGDAIQIKKGSQIGHSKMRYAATLKIPF